MKRPWLIHSCFIENDAEICYIEAESAFRYVLFDDAVQEYLCTRRSYRICCTEHSNLGCSWRNVRACGRKMNK
jgi:hypothetical protein